MQENILFRREISLKVICEKINFQIVIFAISFVFMNGHTCKLVKNILDDVQTMITGEINTAEHHYSKNCILMLYKSKGLKVSFFSIPQLHFTI